MHKQSTSATTLPLPLYYLKRIPFKLVTRKAVFSSKRVIVPSRAVKDEVSQYYNLSDEKIFVIYEGIREEFSDVVTRSGGLEILTKYKLANQRYFFYVGNAYPHKNLESVVRAVSQLNNGREEKILFIIAGSRNVFTKRLEKVIKKYKARDVVRLMGYVEDKELPVLYNNSVGFIYPSLSEGFGLQGLEAIASGTLLICSDIAVFREIYQQNAIFFDPLNSDSIKDALGSVLEMESIKRRTIIDEAKKFIKRYSWEKMAKETLKLYKSFASIN